MFYLRNFYFQNIITKRCVKNKSFFKNKKTGGIKPPVALD